MPAGVRASLGQEEREVRTRAARGQPEGEECAAHAATDRAPPSSAGVGFLLQMPLLLFLRIQPLGQVFPPQTLPPPLPRPPGWPARLRSWNPLGWALSFLPLPGSPRLSGNSGLNSLIFTPEPEKGRAHQLPELVGHGMGGYSGCDQEPRKPHSTDSSLPTSW